MAEFDFNNAIESNNNKMLSEVSDQINLNGDNYNHRLSRLDKDYGTMQTGAATLGELTNTIHSVQTNLSVAAITQDAGDINRKFQYDLATNGGLINKKIHNDMLAEIQNLTEKYKGKVPTDQVIKIGQGLENQLTDANIKAKTKELEDTVNTVWNPHVIPHSKTMLENTIKNMSSDKIQSVAKNIYGEQKARDQYHLSTKAVINNYFKYEAITQDGSKIQFLNQMRADGALDKATYDSMTADFNKAQKDINSIESDGRMEFSTPRDKAETQEVSSDLSDVINNTDGDVNIDNYFQHISDENVQMVSRRMFATIGSLRKNLSPTRFRSVIENMKAKNPMYQGFLEELSQDTEGDKDGVYQGSKMSDVMIQPEKFKQLQQYVGAWTTAMSSKSWKEKIAGFIGTAGVATLGARGTAAYLGYDAFKDLLRDKDIQSVMTNPYGITTDKSFVSWIANHKDLSASLLQKKFADINLTFDANGNPTGEGGSGIVYLYQWYKNHDDGLGLTAAKVIKTDKSNSINLNYKKSKTINAYGEMQFDTIDKDVKINSFSQLKIISGLLNGDNSKLSVDDNNSNMIRSYNTNSGLPTNTYNLDTAKGRSEFKAYRDNMIRLFNERYKSDKSFRGLVNHQLMGKADDNDRNTAVNIGALGGGL